jgi:hypothetical protein
MDGKGLAALYSDDRDPTVRLELQAELEARPNGIAQVLAACRKASRDFDKLVLATWNARRATLALPSQLGRTGHD